ncbi:hypothetical protein F5877DRAFT_72713 [Lentinula edodes]|nr:hypothetical protein F5877DRAFT_72713 [Lentinula edodes]
MASNDYLATLCIACGIDLIQLEHGKKLDRDNTSAKISGQLNKKSAGVTEHQTTESMQQVVALDRFIRALKYSGEPQTVWTNLGCLEVTRSELRNSRVYILKIEDEIAEGRKYRTQSIIRNQRHSYMIDELRLQVSESYAEAEIQSRQEQLKLLKRIEELELRLSKDEWMKQAKRIKELEIQVAREKLVRGKAAHILHNNHDLFAAKDEVLMLLKPALVPRPQTHYGELSSGSQEKQTYVKKIDGGVMLKHLPSLPLHQLKALLPHLLQLSACLGTIPICIDSDEAPSSHWQPIAPQIARHLLSSSFEGLAALTSSLASQRSRGEETADVSGSVADGEDDALQEGASGGGFEELYTAFEEKEEKGQCMQFSENTWPDEPGSCFLDWSGRSVQEEVGEEVGDVISEHTRAHEDTEEEEGSWVLDEGVLKTWEGGAFWHTSFLGVPTTVSAREVRMNNNGAAEVE